MKRRPVTSNEIKVTYSGVQIAYDERKNRWLFDVRGREREAESLEAAKLVIDRPEPKEKPPFDQFEAWYSEYGDLAKIVTVTSVAIKTASWRTADEVWITFKDEKGKPERRKVEARSVFPKNPHNDAAVEELSVLSKRQAELSEAEEAAKKKLKCFVVPKV